jgi:hypothetical protein
MAFATKVQEALTKGFEKVQGFARRTGRNANQLASKGANKIEKAQLVRQEDELIRKLGTEAYSSLVEMDKPGLSRDAPAIRGLLDAIKGIKARIARKDSEYKDIGALGGAKA